MVEVVLWMAVELHELRPDSAQGFLVPERMDETRLTVSQPRWAELDSGESRMRYEVYEAGRDRVDMQDCNLHQISTHGLGKAEFTKYAGWSTTVPYKRYDTDDCTAAPSLRSPCSPHPQRPRGRSRTSTRALSRRPPCEVPQRR